MRPPTLILLKKKKFLHIIHIYGHSSSCTWNATPTHTLVCMHGLSSGCETEASGDGFKVREGAGGRGRKEDGVVLR